MLAGNATLTKPTNYTDITGAYYVAGVTLTNRSAIRTGLAAGAEDPGTWTTTNDESIGFTFWLPLQSTPPTPVTGPSAGGGRRTGEVVVGSPGTVTPGDPPTVIISYQWQRTLTPNDSGSWVEIVGATSENYAPTDGDIGYWLRLCVTYSNGIDTNFACSAAFGPIIAGQGIPLETLDQVQPLAGWGAGY
jgi:hypothetical protein